MAVRSGLLEWKRSALGVSVVEGTDAVATTSQRTHTTLDANGSGSANGSTNGSLTARERGAGVAMIGTGIIVSVTAIGTATERGNESAKGIEKEIETEAESALVIVTVVVIVLPQVPTVAVHAPAPPTAAMATAAVAAAAAMAATRTTTPAA
jgi:F0F1-type ATP synthase membrane subunit c/vacuolar-type H+-ATPase subunit K|eukprot:COSAG06_NODE_57_length_27525_cov_14.855279_4_plen_152_part_00